MNYRSVLPLLGRLLIALALAMLVPCVVSVRSGSLAETKAFLFSAAITAIVGVALDRTFRHGASESFGRREAFFLVSATWISASLAGALPWVFLSGPGSLMDALFESTSGFTTTGASILDDVEAQPASLLLWRSLTQWIGGMGIIVLGLAVLPRLAVGGMQLLAAEAPGPETEKLTPRIAQTAKALWGIYVLLTAVACVALIVTGMSPFDAVNHALTTLSTGGFSTRNGSMGDFGGAVQWVTIAFMFLAGVNFALHFHMLRGRPFRVMRDTELRCYAGLVIAGTLFVLVDLLLHRPAGDPLGALTQSTFQTLTILTTTGFATADYDTWPALSRALLFLMMFVGGCAGSTSGSIKVVRLVIVFQNLRAQLQRIARPHCIAPVRLGRRVVPREIVDQILSFCALFVALFAGGGVLLALSGLDPVSAFSASLTCLANVGPGFGAVGPTHTMSQLPDVSKLILASLMLVGRLELYAVLVTVAALGGSRAGRGSTVLDPVRHVRTSGLGRVITAMHRRP